MSYCFVDLAFGHSITDGIVALDHSTLFWPAWSAEGLLAGYPRPAWIGFFGVNRMLLAHRAGCANR